MASDLVPIFCVDAALSRYYDAAAVVVLPGPGPVPEQQPSGPRNGGADGEGTCL